MTAETETGFFDTELLTTAQEDLCLTLFDVSAIKFGEFLLKLHEVYPELPPSPIYINLRVLRRFPEEKRAAVDAYAELLQGLEFDVLADVPTAATPLVASLSDRLGVGQVTPVLSQKAYGIGAKVNGYLGEIDIGKTAVVIDDLITGAHSKLAAIKILEELGFMVRDVVVLIDRQQGGQEELADKGYVLHSSLTMSQMLKFYLEAGRIDQGEYDRTVMGIEAINAYQTK